MGYQQYEQFIVITADNETKELPQGAVTANFTNLGSASAFLTMGDQTAELPAGGVFNLDANPNALWRAVSINASGTKIQCVYYE